jgi:hypothetical protein
MGGRRVTLPYDAEVEYLESTGTQYIDTGYAFTDDYSFEIDFDGISTDMSLFGARSGNVRTSVVYYSGTTGFSVNIAGYTGTTTPFHLSPIVPNTRMMFKTAVVSNKCSIWIDGESKYMNEAFSGSYISGVTMALFATKYGNNDFREKTSSKVYSVKMWQGSTLVRSFVPVRVGTVGYLFDRANPTGGPNGNGLYGNAGTGSFTVGPDK